MLHFSDLRDNWEIKGIVPWIRKQIMEFIAADINPPKPEARWRHPFHWLTIQSWFNGIIYFVIFVNLAPIIFETVLLIKDKDPQPGGERDFLYGCTWTFTCLYLLEFLLKVRTYLKFFFGLRKKLHTVNFFEDFFLYFFLVDYWKRTSRLLLKQMESS
jgi:hypothetical protein